LVCNLFGKLIDDARLWIEIGKGYLFRVAQR
jgi:hypothetical protein